MKSIQYTIRGIPPSVDKILRRNAQRKGESFNSAVVEALQKGTGVAAKGSSETRSNGLDTFYGVGKGLIGEAEEATFREIRVIDKGAWR